LKRFIHSGIGAVFLWVVGALLLAAVLTPWAWQGGKWLAATAAARELPALVEGLAASCGRAQIGRFFDRCLLFSALVLLPCLLRRIRRIDSRDGTTAQPRDGIPPSSAVVQTVTGVAIAGGLLWGMGLLLEHAGAFVPRTVPPSSGRLLTKVVLPAVAAPLVEEWLFRGLLLGLWLRFARPATACLGTALVFAFLHFLEPPDGSVIRDPAQPLAGFELLGKILLHFTDPLFFITDFATLCAVGLILAWARLRTGGLWFSIGLHAGWVAALKAFNLFYTRVAEHAFRPWGVGDSLRSGVFPLLVLALTAIVCGFALGRFTRASR
jgi:membrane protease YdiL (CAAX protease family)